MQVCQMLICTHSVMPVVSNNLFSSLQYSYKFCVCPSCSCGSLIPCLSRVCLCLFFRWWHFPPVHQSDSVCFPLCLTSCTAGTPLLCCVSIVHYVLIPNVFWVCSSSHGYKTKEWSLFSCQKQAFFCARVISIVMIESRADEGLDVVGH